ncbi:MAG: hypothetical protein NC898_03240 [Candidatus Omnitrophica bacterium]|nr:hypothetical protein [Candidatus Omnitrophota bacterium]MCM8793465.1 hypothetical protein [Candidatus Omnitrophota bacterium]
MDIYRCINCGYKGDKLIFQCNVYDYCVATNELEPEYLNEAPKWVKDKGCGEIEIGEPVACPKCHAWGVDNFELI